MKQKLKFFIKCLVSCILNFFLVPILLSFQKKKKTSLDNMEKINIMLNNFSLNPKSSCITKNEIILPYKYDLQIIVPVYNSERTIERCINSVINQNTDFSYLLIIINDGSKDKTTDILKKYLENSNIIIINQENKGFSGARNRGLDNILSQYIMFLDSDDYLEKDAIETLVKTAKLGDYDIVQGGYRKFYDNNLENEVHYSKRLMGYPWGKVYKSEIFKDVHFPLNYWFEDTICDMIIHPKAKKWKCLPVSVYCYYINPQGISNNFSKYNKTIDSYYITESLLNDKLLLKQDFDLDSLLNYLNQVVMNFKRITLLNEKKINKAIFIAESNLLYKYYVNSLKKTRIKPAYKNLYYSLIKHSYITYYILCRFWNLE